MAEPKTILQDLSEIIVDLMNDDTTTIPCRGKLYKINDDNLPEPAQKVVKQLIRATLLDYLRPKKKEAAE